MADLAKLGIDKLNNDNCQSWKYEAEFVLRRENNWFCNTTEAPASAEKAYDARVQADSKAIGTIGLLIEKSQHVFTRSAKTAKEAWDNLKEHNEKASLSSAVHMYRVTNSLKIFPLYFGPSWQIFE
jgi:hypothetical protein